MKFIIPKDNRNGFVQLILLNNRQS